MFNKVYKLIIITVVFVVLVKGLNLYNNLNLQLVNTFNKEEMLYTGKLNYMGIDSTLWVVKVSTNDSLMLYCLDFSVEKNVFNKSYTDSSLTIHYFQTVANENIISEIYFKENCLVDSKVFKEERMAQLIIYSFLGGIGLMLLIFAFLILTKKDWGEM